MADNTILDLDALMDESLDGVAEAPDFVTPSDGTYNLKVEKAEIAKYTNKDGVEGSRISLQYSIVSTEEVADGQPVVADGSIFSESFTGTQQGLSFFKRQARKLLNVENIDGVALREILASLQNLEFRAVITSRKNGNYTNINVTPIFE